jgi:sugar transferase (PEP-CTERM/EpsH1 system associated)
MRILFLSTNLPVPANSGHAVRTLSLVRALAESCHAVDFLSFAPGPPDNLQPLTSLCHTVSLVERAPVNTSHNADYFGRFAVLLKGRSYAIERFVSSAMQARIRHCLDTAAYECIVADHLYALVNLAATTVPVVLNCHNVESLILERYVGLEKNLAMRLYARVEAKRMREAERQACARSAIAMACSGHDRDMLQRFRADLPIFVVPNCVDTDFFHPEETRSMPESAPTLLFQGVMDWYPNRDAVEFFAQEMLPEIRRAFPNVQFVIAGRNPAPELRRKFAAVPNLEFTGTVPDMRPYLARASVVVVPLRIGSGTRIKILEAAASGKAVVSTGIGAEGLDFEDQAEIVIADEPASFVREVVALLGDPRRRGSIGRAARERVLQRYSQKELTRIMDTVLHDLV